MRVLGFTVSAAYRVGIESNADWLDWLNMFSEAFFGLFFKACRRLLFGEDFTSSSSSALIPTFLILTLLERLLQFASLSSVYCSVDSKGVEMFSLIKCLMWVECLWINWRSRLERNCCISKYEFESVEGILCSFISFIFPMLSGSASGYSCSPYLSVRTEFYSIVSLASAWTRM